MLRRTKILTTLGPATDNPKVLSDLIIAGADVVRINFSHGEPQAHAKRVQMVREVAEQVGKQIAVLGDLQGPKIRIERFANGPVQLIEGEPFTLDVSLDPKAGTATSVGVAYKSLPRDVQASDVLLLNDGQIALEVTAVDGPRIATKVIVGGELSDNKGINKQGGGLSAGALTDKDRLDIKLAAELGVDYLAVSFARDGSDMDEARQLLRKEGGHGQLVAKIERSEAIVNLDRIIQASDAVMVARGDLGVEVGYAELTGLQKHIISATRKRNRVVITATQMMESMIHNPIPTRAEVSDVANAVMDGTDAVMLSGESAVGKYPVKAVQAMAQVILGAEKYESSHSPIRHRSDGGLFEKTDEAIAMAVMYTANHLKVKAIVALTESGSTPLWMSRIRADIPIYAFTRHEITSRRVMLYRGVYPVTFDVTHTDAQEVYANIFRLMLQKKMVEPGDRIILTKGELSGVSGKTNSMKILEVRV
ncbi:MAG TPA: pyruvate kinase [Povalibacter sp.]|uniref:pyruvate kinase n=1 Tax=Povalibacter sp. TaxID=1962978 RepID=UPI002CFCE880|nr:pyruvate kinase [Povalibacter sp.]HMN45327.1 pyruvate kinase [Povalibacter sp.]